MWFVVKLFTDSQDKDHLCNEGDPFPRERLEVSEGRNKELSSSKNLQGTPLIVSEPKQTKKRGRKKKE